MATGTSKIKMRVGVHEFEAEGSQSFVQAERQRFEALVRATHVPTETPMAIQPQGSIQARSTSSIAAPEKERYAKIFKVDGQGVLALIGQLPGKDRERDAIILLLLGYQTMLMKNTVTGADLTKSMNHSGYPTIRVDRMMGKYNTDGTILTGGKQRRGRYYYLSAPGAEKAKSLAEEMLKLSK